MTAMRARFTAPTANRRTTLSGPVLKLVAFPTKSDQVGLRRRPGRCGVSCGERRDSWSFHIPDSANHPVPRFLSSAFDRDQAPVEFEASFASWNCSCHLLFVEVGCSEAVNESLLDAEHRDFVRSSRLQSSAGQKIGTDHFEQVPPRFVAPSISAAISSARSTTVNWLLKSRKKMTSEGSVSLPVR